MASREDEVARRVLEAKLEEIDIRKRERRI
jgi:hypothetical protein